ncbi:helix-turn-helix transcriptional regulator [Georgenia satyanarayanai]|uniref:helix-turn-helix transcriptional regulator n=1 Tax=Georgenia satyanarayanai TaxID=860221 RepID=UPI00203D6FFF|nr:helix-turn-helix transcriptional regulator [Georgenia satyanarayanai]MCM3660318.1 helix-turn-helix transcriptional regulator [Georgenia satyanarayanai]
MVPRTAATSGTDNPVRRRRREHRLTQAELARAVGVSRQTVIAVERGDYAPSVHLALRLARALGVTVEELFAEDENTTTGEARR